MRTNKQGNDAGRRTQEQMQGVAHGQYTCKEDEEVKVLITERPNRLISTRPEPKS